jgi:uncharacterized protein YbjT (DUF2867 family)
MYRMHDNYDQHALDSDRRRPQSEAQKGKKAMYVIAGATGKTGSVVADTLLAQGEPVRIIVREAAKGATWQAKGAELAVAALEDTAALTAALRGADGAYLLVPPRPASSDPLGENRAVIASQARAVRDAGVPHVVLLSSIGAQHATGTGPIQSVHHAEQALAATGAKLTAIRASYFLENWGAALGMIDQGILPTFVPTDLRYSMVAAADIGRTAAAALVEQQPGVIELAGPRDHTADEIAAIVSGVVARPVRAQQMPLDAVVPTFTRFGISPEVAALFREMYEGFGSGRITAETGNRRVRGAVAAETVLRGLLGR